MRGVVERIVQRVSSSRAFARVGPYFVPALDSAVHRLTGGRAMLSARLLPSLVLTSTGARSGLPRRTPLACLPERDADGAECGWIVIGSNFGRPAHPAWTANLLARPRAEISRRGRQVPVTARLLRGAEREAVWRRVVAFWPPYARYQARVEREIRLFRLESSAKGARCGGPGGPPLR
ncbi:nitroreductase family deazaflavin-dependent oxidoreductase [Streptomyces orinoci]|uniref:Nitroreductase family deazaflavin-dependent oxidoreductase n=1 Tax=Streptomyces orinoci TaxID=67339 RepID=A0ABV3JY43_STRON|nr:nitroreductase family deazaflavin-dependent oxidoreductase [Streptomyces orinoci]